MMSSIRIIDFTQYLPGPFATQRLAEMGAEIIKVEQVEGGDPARLLADGLVFKANNRHKKSVTANLKDKDDVHKVLELIKTADVVIESFRPGVMKRLNLSYEDLKKHKSDLIYCSLTGYGQDSEFSHLGGHDLNYMALSGVQSQIKDKGKTPIHPTITFADLIGGMAASEAILQALLKREKTGEGSYVDLSITDAMVSLLHTHFIVQEALHKGDGVPFIDGSIISYSLYETKEGRFMSLAALEPKFWANFCHAVGHPEWIEKQFSKTEDENEVFIKMKDLFKTKSFAEWSDFGKQVDCCLAPVLEIHEVQNHPALKTKNVTEHYTKRLISHRLGSVPALGEHNSVF